MGKKRHYFIAAVLLLFAGNSAFSVTKTTINGSSYLVDTLQYSKVGPGTYYSSVKFTGETSGLVFRTFFLHSDVDNPNVECRVGLGRDTIIGTETIRGYAMRQTAPGNYYFAGVNGDYHETSGEIGTPSNACNVNGQIATPPIWFPTFVISDTMEPWCMYVYDGGLKMNVNGGNEIKIDHINGKRYANELVLYNSNIGKYTHTSPGGKEIAVQLADGEKWKINSDVRVKVSGAYSESGNMAIPAGQAVLSADGTAMTVIENLKEGDEIVLHFRETLSDVKVVDVNGVAPNITQTVGGNVYLVHKGEVFLQDDESRNPRTMLGYTKGKKQLVFRVLDGRSTISSGGTYREMSDIMIFAGAEEAINIDGGGSSTMYLQNLGVMNKPSDGTERSVGNGTYLVLKAPEDNEIASISFVDYSMQCPRHGIFTPKFYGYNKYGMLIDTDVQGIELSCPTELGEIKDKRIFIGTGNGTHALTGTYNGMVATMPVTVSETDKLQFHLNSVINNGYKNYPVEVEANVNERIVSISPSALSWNTDDATIASIDPEGIVKGITDGSTKIHGSIGNFTGELTVNVEKPLSRIMPVDKDMDISTWKITQTGGNNRVVTPYENGMKITYTGVSGRGPNIKLTKSIRLWSLPDTFRIRINPGDAPVTGITVSTTANNGGVINTKVDVPEANKMNVIDLPTDKWCNAKELANYPIFLNYIQFDMGAANSGKEYTIEIPGLEAVYADVPVSGVEENLVNNRITVTPNPVKAGENVLISGIGSGESTLAVYNTSGQEVKRTGISSDNTTSLFSTSGLVPGIYIISIIQDGSSYSSKLVIE